MSISRPPEDLHPPPRFSNQWDKHVICTTTTNCSQSSGNFSLIESPLLPRLQILDWSPSSVVHGMPNSTLDQSPQQQISPYWKTVKWSPVLSTLTSSQALHSPDLICNKVIDSPFIPNTNRTRIQLPEVPTLRRSTAIYHSRSEVPKESIQLYGLDFSLDSEPHTLQPEMPISPSIGSVSTISTLVEEDGSQSPSVSKDTSQTTFWAITTWEGSLDILQILTTLKRIGAVRILGSDVHRKEMNEIGTKCPTGPHRHWLVQFPHTKTRAVFPKSILTNCWVNAFKKRDNMTLNQCLQRYIKYIKAKGPDWILKGQPFPQETMELHVKDKRTKSEIIYNEILNGKRMSYLCALYPQMYSSIVKLMRFRPARQHRTDLVYYWGEPGVGKTTNIMRVLQSIYKLYPEVDYYCKLGGIDRWFDGYDNQKIVYIDDPIAVNVSRNEESVQRLKNVISTGDTLVEIKGGSMVFDSSLIIILSNMTPKALAESCGVDNANAIFRRFTDTCGAYQIRSRADCLKKMVEHLILIIKRNMNAIHGLDIDVHKVVHNIMPVRLPKYDDIQYAQCNTSNYFNNH